jgi:hypothetical protein
MVYEWKEADLLQLVVVVDRGHVLQGRDFGCHVQHCTCQWNLGFGVWGLGFGVWGLGAWDLVFGVWCLVFGVQALGFEVWGLGRLR